MSKRLLVSVSWLAMALLSTTAQAQETISYQYDALGRLIGSKLSGGPNSNVVTTTSFDPAGNRKSYAVSGASGSTPTPTPGGPVANPDAFTITANQACSAIDLYVLANDQDPGGHYPLTIVSISTTDPFVQSNTSHISYGASGTVYGGITNVSYVVQNSIGQTAVGQAKITIEGTLFCD